MKNSAEIVKWEPLPDIPSKMFLEGLIDDYEGFRLLLKGDRITSGVLKIEFRTRIGYRNMDETYRLKSLNKYPILTSPWSLFKIKNDEFVIWVCDESNGILDDSNLLTNYIFCTPNDIVEVISKEEPVVYWL